MRKLWRDLQGDQGGATLVWVTLSMVALIAMVALTIDGGYAYAQRRRMQNAADAAAIAGARLRALGGTTVQVGSVVNQYATANGANGVSWTYPSSQKVQVTASCTFPTFFAGIIGLPQMTASAVAEASIQYLSEAGNLLPMRIKDDDYGIGQPCVLWDKDDAMKGSFGWLDWDGVPVSAVELEDNIANPSNSGFLAIGSWVPVGPGVKASSQVQSALNTWIGQHVTIPFYDEVQGEGANTRYRIAGFGEFVLTDYNFQGGDKWVSGYFRRWVEFGPGGGPNRGLSSVRLTQ